MESGGADASSVDVGIKIFSLIAAAFFGSSANRAYRNRIERLVSELPEDPPGRKKFIRRKGDTNPILALILAFLWLGMVVIMAGLSMLAELSQM